MASLMNADFNPAESSEFVMQKASFVSIRPEGIDALAKEVCQGLLDNTITPANFSSNEYHPKPDDQRAPNWLFLMDTLNFCFWTPGNATKWQVSGATGYFALCAAIRRALDEGIDFTNPAFYAHMTAAQLAHILRGDDDGRTACPLLDERLQCLHQVGEHLLAKYDGDFANCVRSAGGSAQRLLRLIVDEFPCFRDEAEFGGRRVALYKRAQITIGDVWACYEGRGLGAFDDIEAITMFADYRVPQVLHYFGAIEYTPALMETLRADRMLANGSAEEVEIRAASIHAVELLKRRVREQLVADGERFAGVEPTRVNSILLDHFLWDYRRRFEGEREWVPFHKTISIYY